MPVMEPVVQHPEKQKYIMSPWLSSGPENWQCHRAAHHSIHSEYKNDSTELKYVSLDMQLIVSISFLPWKTHFLLILFLEGSKHAQFFPQYLNGMISRAFAKCSCPSLFVFQVANMLVKDEVSVLEKLHSCPSVIPLLHDNQVILKA